MPTKLRHIFTKCLGGGPQDPPPPSLSRELPPIASLLTRVKRSLMVRHLLPFRRRLLRKLQTALGGYVRSNIPILPMAFLTFAEAKVESAPPFVLSNPFPKHGYFIKGLLPFGCGKLKLIFGPRHCATHVGHYATHLRHSSPGSIESGSADIIQSVLNFSSLNEHENEDTKHVQT